MAERVELTRRPWAGFAALLGFGMLAVYVAVIMAQGGDSVSKIVPWVLLMATPTVLAFVSVFARDVRVARGLLIGAAALFGIVGALGILTIGIGFLLAAAAAVIAITRLFSSSRRRQNSRPFFQFPVGRVDPSERCRSVRVFHRSVIARNKLIWEAVLGGWLPLAHFIDAFDRSVHHC